MMPLSFLLQARTVHEFLIMPNYWPSLSDFVIWCENMDHITFAVLILGGYLFLFSGFKMHRLLIGLTGGVAGAYTGAGICMRSGLPVYVGIIVGAAVLGVAAWYLTAWAAAAVGAICGALLGASLWKMFNLDPQFVWSGALTGAVALGLLCFIIFRISVMLFTSLQGAVMLVLGVLGLAYQYPFVRPTLESSIRHWPFILPALILGLMAIGLGFQYFKGPGGGGSGKPAAATASGGERKPAKRDKAE